MYQIISIGLKVLAAVGVGAAVYLGIDKLAKTNNNPNPTGNENPNSNLNPTPENQNSNNIQQTGNGGVEMRTEDKIINGLKTAQDICGRAFSLCQNLAIAADNIIKIFGGRSYGGNYSGYSGGYYNNCCPNNGYHDKYGDPPGFRRISPYILEFVGDDNNGNYGGYNNYYNNPNPHRGY